MIRRVVATLAIVTGSLLAATAVAPPAAADGPPVNGGGSSFAALEIDQWRAEVAKKPYQLTINYLSQGSTYGRQQYMTGNLEFAASDIPFTDAELPQLNTSGRKDFVYVPISAGGLGMMYNLVDAGGTQVANLNLTRRGVCRIFTEPNMYWDDQEIAAANPTISLPHRLVRPIVRSDGSGTSYVLSEFCLTVASDVWQAFVTRSSDDASATPEFQNGRATSNWPIGWGVVSASNAADGVASAVANPVQGADAITYNEAGYAALLGFPNANVENASGAFTQPTEEAVSIALGYARGRANGTFELNYTGGDPAAYFPSTYSYVIAQTTGFPADKGNVLARFLCYAVTKGQRKELTDDLHYARLSAPLVELAKNAIAQIPGAPPWEQCRVESAPPPPAAPTSSGGGAGSTGSTGGGSPGAGGTPNGTGSEPSQGDAGSGAGPAGSSGSTGGGSTTGSSVGTGSGSTGSTGGSGGAPGGVEGAVPTGGSSGESTAEQCVDPTSGLPAECASVFVVTGSGASAPSAGSGTKAGSTTKAPPNPEVGEDESSGPDGNTIVWWLLQGVSVCALGVGLGGLRRKIA